MSDRNRILIGVLETANNIAEIADCLAGRGWRVTTVVIGNPYFGHDYDHVIRVPRWFDWPAARMLYWRTLLLFFFLRHVFSHDVFLFVWSVTFLPLNLDLLILRLMRKRVVMMNCGADVRYLPIQDRLDLEVLGFDILGGGPGGHRLEYVKAGQPFLRTFYLQKIEELSGATIISARNQATFLGRQCGHFRFPQRPLLDGPKPARSVPLIVHAPSVRLFKGTRFVLQAVDMLREEGLEFEFRLLEGLPNEEVLRSLVQADIAVDQVGTWVARFAIEAMAAGCAVVGGNLPAYSGYPEVSPVLQFEPDAARLAAILRRLIQDPVFRERKMDECYRYWESWYSPDAFADYFARVLDGSVESLDPLPGHRELLLEYAENAFQRSMIRLFH